MSYDPTIGSTTHREYDDVIRDDRPVRERDLIVTPPPDRNSGGVAVVAILAILAILFAVWLFTNDGTTGTTDTTAPTETTAPVETTIPDTIPPTIAP